MIICGIFYVAIAAFIGHLTFWLKVKLLWEAIQIWSASSQLEPILHLKQHSTLEFGTKYLTLLRSACWLYCRKLGQRSQK